MEHSQLPNREFVQHGSLMDLPPQDAAAVLSAFQRFAVPGAAALDRHGLKCAAAAVLGVKPGRQQVSMLMRGAGEDGLLPFDAFQAAMQVWSRPCVAAVGECCCISCPSGDLVTL